VGAFVFQPVRRRCRRTWIATTSTATGIDYRLTLIEFARELNGNRFETWRRRRCRTGCCTLSIGTLCSVDNAAGETHSHSERHFPAWREPPGRSI
jgi:hypothetical protein